MRILLGQHFTQNSYIDFKKRGNIMYDECIANVDDLVNLLSLHLGIHITETTTVDRQAAYHNAFSKMMAKGNNMFSASWAKNSLGVSNECLKWRDALVECGWKAEMKQPSERLHILAKVENDFNCKNQTDNRVAIIPHLEKTNPLPPGSVIKVAAFSMEELSPVTQKILSLLKDKGTRIDFEEKKSIANNTTDLAKIQDLILNDSSFNDNKIELSGDGSLEIWEFPTSLDAYRYIASQEQRDSELFICNNSKSFDNVQRMMGMPTSGSRMNNSHPLIAQLFMLGISLFDYPINIRNLVSWLMMPDHPIQSNLRKALAKVIVEEGGYENEKYKTTIEEYIKEEQANGGKNRDKILNSISNFIPTPHKEGVDKNEILNFLIQLSNWCGKMANIHERNDIKRNQFNKVFCLCQALNSIIRDYEDNIIPFVLINSWASSLYRHSDFSLYECQSGSRWITNQYNIIDDADIIIWSDCYNYNAAKQPTEFLNANEISELTNQGCHFWNNKLFNIATMQNVMRPVLMAKKQLILVTVKQDKNEVTNKHPLIIRLKETCSSIDSIIKRPQIAPTEVREIERVDNNHSGVNFTFNKMKSELMPHKESYTSLDTLIQYPFDYMMDKVLLFHDKASYEMDPIDTVKGNVAHAVIEHLFVGSNNEIKNNIDTKFEEILDKVIKEHGAILLLKENILEAKMFKEDLKENIVVLLDIIKKNNLTVLESEKKVNGKIGLIENDTDDPEINGFVDMLLKNQNNELIVFDFKWTRSKDKHKRLLEENVSLQLAIYEKLIKIETDKNILASAYFTMPQHKLYTTSEYFLDTNHIERVKPLNNDDLIQKIINSYRYRRNEICKGIISTEEEYPINEGILDYVANTPSDKQDLVPLDKYNNMHPENLYSNYKCFKGRLK